MYSLKCLFSNHKNKQKNHGLGRIKNQTRQCPCFLWVQAGSSYYIIRIQKWNAWKTFVMGPFHASCWCVCVITRIICSFFTLTFIIKKLKKCVLHQFKIYFSEIWRLSLIYCWFLFIEVFLSRLTYWRWHNLDIKIKAGKA